MINFNNSTSQDLLTIYSFEKCITILKSKSRFSLVTAATCTSVIKIAALTCSAAECFFKGTCNLFAFPFSNKFSASTGLCLYADGIISLIFLFIFTPVSPFIATCFFIFAYEDEDSAVQNLNEKLAEVRKTLQEIEGSACSPSSDAEGETMATEQT